MITIINILFPVISIILLGAVIGRLEKFDDSFFSGVNRLVYRYGLAPLLFGKTAGMSISFGEVATPVALILSLIMVLTFTAWIASSLLGLEDRARGAFIHGSMRGNYAYIGLPVIFYAFSGTAYAGRATELAIIIFTPAILFHNGLAILLMNIYNRPEGKPGAAAVMKDIALDPLVAGCTLGLVLNILSVPIPVALTRTCDSLGRMAMPLALLGIGATMDIRMLRGNLRAPVISAGIKTFVGPAAAFVLISFSGMDMGSLPAKILLILSACSTGVSTFIITEQYGGDSALAGSTVFLSAVMSVCSLTSVLVYIS